MKQLGYDFAAKQPICTICLHLLKIFLSDNQLVSKSDEKLTWRVLHRKGNVSTFALRFGRKGAPEEKATEQRKRRF